jgi:hypothetical protein
MTGSPLMSKLLRLRFGQHQQRQGMGLRPRTRLTIRLPTRLGCKKDSSTMTLTRICKMKV